MLGKYGTLILLVSFLHDKRGDHCNILLLFNSNRQCSNRKLFNGSLERIRVKFSNNLMIRIVVKFLVTFPVETLILELKMMRVMFMLKWDSQWRVDKFNIGFVFLDIAGIGRCDDWPIFPSSMNNKFGVIVGNVWFADAVIENLLQPLVYFGVRGTLVSAWRT